MEGIDPEFLAALPPELQAEVMENQVGGVECVLFCVRNCLCRQLFESASGALQCVHHAGRLHFCCRFVLPLTAPLIPPNCSGGSGGCGKRSAGGSKQLRPLLLRPARLPAQRAQRRRAQLQRVAQQLGRRRPLRQGLRQRRRAALLTWTLAACWPLSRLMFGRRCCSGAGWCSAVRAALCSALCALARLHISGLHVRQQAVEISSRRCAAAAL